MSVLDRLPWRRRVARAAGIAEARSRNVWARCDHDCIMCGYLDRVAQTESETLLVHVGEVRVDHVRECGQCSPASVGGAS